MSGNYIKTVNINKKKQPTGYVKEVYKTKIMTSEKRLQHTFSSKNVKDKCFSQKNKVGMLPKIYVVYNNTPLSSMQSLER